MARRMEIERRKIKGKEVIKENRRKQRRKIKQERRLKRTKKVGGR